MRCILHAVNLSSENLKKFFLMAVKNIDQNIGIATGETGSLNMAPVLVAHGRFGLKTSWLSAICVCPKWRQRYQTMH